MLSALCACAVSKPSAGSESHFLRACQADVDCGEGLGCWLNLCTRPCGSEADCEGLASNASCLPRPSAGKPLCDVACEAPSDCGETPANTACEGNRCRPEASANVSDLGVAPDPFGRPASLVEVSCGGGPFFVLSDLTTIVPLEDDGPGGIAEAADSFLHTGEGDFWPQTGWLILRKTGDEAVIVHHAGMMTSFMSFAGSDGRWSWNGATDLGRPCDLHYRLPSGLTPVDWRPDPQAPVEPEDTTLQLLVRELDCASGQALGDRLREPVVQLSDEAVRITFTADSPPGSAQTCPPNPEASATIELSEPIGDRVLVEGLDTGLNLTDFLP